MTQLCIELKVRLRDALAGIAIDGWRAKAERGESLAGRADKRILRLRRQWNVMTVRSADFAECWNIGADNAAVMKHCFDNRQTETLNQRRRKQQFAMFVTPLQLGVSNSPQEDDPLLKPEFVNGLMDVFCFRPFDTNQYKRRVWADFSCRQEALKDA